MINLIGMIYVKRDDLWNFKKYLNFEN